MTKKCPKCQAVSGDDWSQCDGACPMPMSPHFELDDRAFGALAPMLDERLDGMTQEEIERAKETCLCGDPMAQHDAARTDHAPCSVYDFMLAPPDPFTDEIEGLEELF